MMHNRPREHSSSLEGQSLEKIFFSEAAVRTLPLYLSLAYCTSPNLSAMFMEQCVPVKLSQYLLDFSLSYGSHVKSLIMIVFVNLLMADVFFSGIIGKFSEISLL